MRPFIQSRAGCLLSSDIPNDWIGCEHRGAG
jgi:hypothetical protein